MPYLAFLLLAAPLLSAVLVWFGRARPRVRVAQLSVAFASLTWALALAAFLHGSAPPVVVAGGVMLQLDPLARLMALTVASISLVVHVYSVRYMAEEPGYARFFALLDLMTAVILLMVLAQDLITLLIAWQLVGVVLYFLLAQDLTRPAAGRYALWSFLTYRLGDVPLVLAAVLLYQAHGTVSLPEIFQRMAAAPHAHQVAGVSLSVVTGLLVVLSAFARSAQVPLHTWLPYTMEGPTPVSALMHAGIVNAGGFLLNRFAPVFVHAGAVLHVVFAVGLITAVLGSVLMLMQNDVKKALGYSTMGQMGFMFVECGVGAFSLAIYHLIAHGLFKGTLFLGAGSIIGNARRHDGVPPDTLYTFVVERRPEALRLPWLLAAGITLVVPFTLLIASHWLVDGKLVRQQGALILLFFGWVTGAQLLFATYRLRADNPWRLMGMIILSLVIVVAGYTVIGHGFDLFLYPNRAMAEALFAAASIPVGTFEALVAVLTLAVVLGWLFTYHAAASDRPRGKEASRLRLAFYSLLSRELYVPDLYAWLARAILAGSRRLNLWWRWG
ncbi:NADH-quinone oxidoreductase subunit 5 family protein [Thiobacter aerophilum]|uniref:Proton-conducting transporter membrane subunit n=1 Tax=Thiobacter aerophilum TaxID=3121275 RepID=A0ABV0EK25_9BURK